MRTATLKPSQFPGVTNDDQGTASILTVDPRSDGTGGVVLKVCELPNRGNAHDISCVPRGIKQVFKWGYSNAHGRNLYRADIGDRVAIEWHSYNVAGDRAKGYAVQALGCFGPGLDFHQFKAGDWLNKELQLKKDQWGVSGSSTAVAQLENALRDSGGNQEDFELTIL